MRFDHGLNVTYIAPNASRPVSSPGGDIRS